MVWNSRFWIEGSYPFRVPSQKYSVLCTGVFRLLDPSVDGPCLTVLQTTLLIWYEMCKPASNVYLEHTHTHTMCWLGCTLVVVTSNIIWEYYPDGLLPAKSVICPPKPCRFQYFLTEKENAHPPNIMNQCSWFCHNLLSSNECSLTLVLNLALWSCLIDTIW